MHSCMRMFDVKCYSKPFFEGIYIFLRKTKTIFICHYGGKVKLYILPFCCFTEINLPGESIAVQYLCNATKNQNE